MASSKTRLTGLPALVSWIPERVSSASLIVGIHDLLLANLCVTFRWTIYSGFKEALNPLVMNLVSNDIGLVIRQSASHEGLPYQQIRLRLRQP